MRESEGGKRRVSGEEDERRETKMSGERKIKGE
jgi:hypothetical protein